jgi:hypothetical protein
MVDGAHLDEAVALNLEMTSPISRTNSYAGWHIVGRDDKSANLEILSAFVDKMQVDSVMAGFDEAGFNVYAVESKALALARLLREQGDGFDVSVASIIFSINGNGMEFLIIRSGQLYFRYFVSWRDIQGEGREIAWDVFQSAFLRHFRQVVNYYEAHWKDGLRNVFLIAGEMEENVTRMISENFPLQAKRLVATIAKDANPEWFAPIGGALRGLMSPHDDRELNLLGVSARKEFRKHEIIGFLKFWRIVMPSALLLLLAGVFTVDMYLVRARGSNELKSGKGISQEERKTIDDFAARVKSFNTSVTAIKSAGKDTFKKMVAFELVEGLFKASSSTLLRFGVQEKKNVISLIGWADSEARVTKLVDSFKASPQAQDVNLPLTDVIVRDDGVSFSMTFTFIAPKTR